MIDNIFINPFLTFLLFFSFLNFHRLFEKTTSEEYYDIEVSFGVSLMIGVLMSIGLSYKIFQKICLSFSMLYIYGAIVILILYPIFRYIFKTDKVFLYGMLSIAYLYIILVLHYTNIEYTDKNNKQVHNYKVVDKYRMRFPCEGNRGRASGEYIKDTFPYIYACYTRHIEYCNDERNDCITHELYSKKEYKKVEIGNEIQLIKYNGYWGTCWKEIEIP